MRRVNFLHSDAFQYKFKRSPKLWTLEQIHDLWIRANERSNNRYKETRNHIEFSLDKLKIKSKDKFNLYFQQGVHLRQYSFSWNHDYQTYAYSTETVNLKNREDKLEFLCCNEEAFILGQQYHELVKLESRIQYRVYAILLEVVNKKLKEHFKGKIAPNNFITEISNRKYFIYTNKRYGNYCVNFEIGDEYKGDVVNISNEPILQ